MKRIGMGMACVGLIVVGFAVAANQEGKKVDGRVFELRTYHVVPGRMPAMHQRFRDHTNKLLEKHGMKLIGFWNPTGKDAETTLIYLVAHPSEEAAKKNWDAFRNDDAWKVVKEASEKDGKIVEKVDVVFMTPADYSALK
jgi:hypothetical protein